ncbi:MAG: S8 family serine peptidase [Bacteroidetes bacterium]|nr:S8 family serine peptidase [Bacteroidota bacterium]
MKYFCLFALIFFAFLPRGHAGLVSQLQDDTVKKGIPDTRVYAILNMVRQKAAAGAVVKVAVIDDGFRLSHLSLKDFIYTNRLESPGNFQDDDNNGYQDDLHGWDISDNDPDVSVPKGRENMFYHGTYVAGIIANLFQSCFGGDAGKVLQIIPVKVLSDHANNLYLQDGYKGIKYASDLGADIICCAWSGGKISEEEKSILDGAIRKGIMIIGSAGNLYAEKVDPPASYAGVFCVAALDSTLKKSRYSNYGMRIDIAAPGDSVYGPHPLADNAFIHENGTSPATAIITGCAAMLKAINPKASASDIFDALTNTATPVDSLNLSWCGKLGAGLPDMSKAIAYISDPDYKFSGFASSRSKGKIFFRKKERLQTWNIRPYGAYKGVHISSVCPDNRKIVKIYTGDSLWYNGTLGGLSKWMFIPGSRFKVELQPKTGLPKDLGLSYYMETIDSTSLYCHDIQYVSADNGSIEDGSGDGNYANNSSCKWQISVPADKRIRLEFSDIDTQPNVDFVWIFDGTSTLPENLLAKFSGITQPPVITSLSNKILVWFLTDGHSVGKGWKLSYTCEPAQ